MHSRIYFKRPPRSLIFAALAYCFLFLTASPLLAKDGHAWLPWNTPADRSLCPDEPTFVWVEHEHGQECIRYYPGEDIRNASVVIAQFYGDRDKVMRQPVDQIRNNTQQFPPKIKF